MHKQKAIFSEKGTIKEAYISEYMSLQVMMGSGPRMVHDCILTTAGHLFLPLDAGGYLLVETDLGNTFEARGLGEPEHETIKLLEVQDCS